MIRLLDVDPELGAGLTAEARAEALRYARVPTTVLSTGAWRADRLVEHDEVRGPVRGFLVLEGLVAMRMRLQDRACTRPVFPGELILLDGSPADSVPLRWEWMAYETSRLAIVDRRLWSIGHLWPELADALLDRAGLAVRRGQLSQAISQLARVEDRLLAFFWSVADSRGVVRGERVRVAIRLTHDSLAQAIGARRPTVTLGLRGLAEADLLRTVPNGFELSRRSLERFELPEVYAAPGPLG